MTAEALTFAEGLALPFEAVTDCFGWVGNRGSGKSYGAKRAAEAMLRAGVQVVVLDPVDVWWGLRYGKDDDPGLPVYVFGGIRADLPLEPESGELLADTVVDQGISAVLSLRGMSRADQIEFVRAFLQRLYLRKGEEKHRTPLHLVIEEAHVFAPQTIVSGDRSAAKCLVAVQDVVLQGRSSGIGVSLVTQRVAHLSKSVLELVEFMAAFRTTGPNAQKALRGWFANQDDEKERFAEFERGLPRLGQGQCWAWAPLHDVFGKVRILEAATFDSSATPETGQALRPRGDRATVDLDMLGERMAALRQEMEDNDPEKLREKIARLDVHVAELETQAARLREALERVDQEPQTVEVVTEVVREVIPPALGAVVAAARACEDRAHATFHAELMAALRTLRERSMGSLAQIETAIANHEETTTTTTTHPEPTPVPIPEQSEWSAPPARPAQDNGDAPRGAPGRMLAVLAQFPQGRTRSQLGMLAGVSTRKTTLRNALGKLRNLGYITVDGDTVKPTREGLDAAGGIAPMPPSGSPELLDHWRAKLGEGVPRRLFDLLATPGPGGDTRTLTREEACEALGVDPTATTMRNSVGKLRNLGLLEEHDRRFRLVPELQPR